ncbi:hypothetical protein MRX96_052616 [Rhipicephalus microplus]
MPVLDVYAPSSSSQHQLRATNVDAILGILKALAKSKFEAARVYLLLVQFAPFIRFASETKREPRIETKDVQRRCVQVVQFHFDREQQDAVAEDEDGQDREADTVIFI